MPKKGKKLWKRGRSERPAPAPEEVAAPEPPRDDSPTVGATLRQQREARDEDLRYVAQVLRIRYPYLKAIEDGMVDALPGPTYAVGFVRTYADHLGLDTDSLVSQFKAEVEGLNARADLRFPAPMPESKIPSGAILIVAGLLAVLIYGGWMYFSSKDEQVAEIVPQLPNRISEIIKGTPSEDVTQRVDETNKAAAANAGTGAPELTGTPQAADTAETKAATPTADSQGKSSIPAGDLPKQPPARETAASTVAPKPTSEQAASISTGPAAAAPTQDVAAEATEPGAQSASPEPVPSALPSAVAEPQETTQVASVSPTENVAAASTEQTPPVARSNTVYGRDNSDARVVMQAIADSWVEVRDTDTNELLLTRVLFKGDSYRVPNRPGLTLLTGNAGGLKITVDGRPVPAIGPLGSVRRDVALDPENLHGKSANAPSSGDGGESSTDAIDNQ